VADGPAIRRLPREKGEPGNPFGDFWGDKLKSQNTVDDCSAIDLRALTTVTTLYKKLILIKIFNDLI
jgi:hypothetical protein